MTNENSMLNSIIETALSQKASDIHFSPGRKPTLRVSGELLPIEETEILKPEDTLSLLSSMAEKRHLENLEKKRDSDFSYSHAEKVRFRVNAYYNQGKVSIAMRLINTKIKTLEELSLPPSLYDLTLPNQGFILFVGPAGHGKSTSLAALIDYINHEHKKHIVTVEDPIEYLYTQDQSIINQREVFSDTTSFASALRAVLREDADVILVGEMRDPETISTAVTAAETGHLIFATLHTNDAPQTIDRIIDSFPAGQQGQIRSQLANTILGIVSQRLIPRLDGGLVPAIEIMFGTPAVRNMIREKKVHQIGLAIETSSEAGMVSMNQSLINLVKKGLISAENAEVYSNDVESLRGGLTSQ
jgi:twitching motility protein PilT